MRALRPTCRADEALAWDFVDEEGVLTWLFYVYLIKQSYCLPMSLVELAPQEALKTFFGFDEFKGEQEKAILSVLEGRDTFVIMPTGGGSNFA